jgi:Zn-dependent peptidase ImmA (M78 family)
VSLLELELGIRVFVRPLPSGSISGLFVYDDDLGACVLLNRNHPRTRRALTAAHELGHLVSARRQPGVVDLASGPQSREEKYATAFGLAFMMPGPLVRQRYWEFRRETGRFSPRHLILMAHAFHVSVEAMCRRLEGFGLVPGGTWDSLKDRGFTGEAVRQVLGDGPETEERPVVPPRLWLLAAGAYQRGLLSEGQLARMLHMDRVEVREMLDALGAEEDDDLDAIAAD